MYTLTQRPVRSQSASPTLSPGVVAALNATAALAEAIRELGEVPSGHLYARVMQIMDYTTFSRMIDVLVRTKLVRRDVSGLLTWIG